MGISVLMSVYKKENPVYLKAALESVMEQTLLPDEIVLIKDGPLTTELEEVITSIEQKLKHTNSDKKIVIRTYQFEKNVQLGRALQKGVAFCAHELIARMDTDDIACTDRLQKQYSYMREHEEVAVLGGYIEEFCEDANFTNVKTIPTDFESVRNYARYRNPLNHMTVMFRKSAILDAGNYRHYPFLEDYDLWSRVINKGYTIENLPDVLVKARVGNELYGRRGGFDYCKRYLRLRLEQRKLGLTTWWECLIACAITIAITIIPSGARKQVYQKLLRK